MEDSDETAFVDEDAMLMGFRLGLQVTLEHIKLHQQKIWERALV